RVRGDPVPRDVDSPSDPDGVVALDVVEEARERGEPAGATRNAAVQADRQHLGGIDARGVAFRIEYVEGVAKVGIELPAGVNKPGHLADLVAALPDGATNPAAIAINNAGNNCPTGPCGAISDDDVALIWLQGQPVTGAQVATY